MTDSDATQFYASNTGGLAPQQAAPDTSSSQQIVFSVWDGDWAIHKKVEG